MLPLEEAEASPVEQAEADRVAEVLKGFERGQLLDDAAAEPLIADLVQLYQASAAFRPGVAWSASRTLSQAGGLACQDPFPGEFRLLRPLGQGGFGEVWLAEDLNLGRQVALKRVQLSSNSERSGQQLAALRNDARCLGALKHPNIVQVHAWRQAGDAFYLVLQYVAGGSFADRLKKEGPLDWQHAARYLADVGDALVEVHRHGVIHCDIKPANLLWEAAADGAFLTDFGVSLHLAEGSRPGGTLPYMPPEAFAGTVLPAFDVYSLAVTLFQLMTGRLPFEAKSIAELMEKTRRGLLDPDARFQDVPEPLERLIRAGLSADAERRPSLNDFIASLRRDLNHLLADTLASPALQRPAAAGSQVNLRLTVSRWLGGERYALVAATHPQPQGRTRDMKKVPAAPEQVKLRTGDRVRIEVVADRTGFVQVFNVGPSGALNLLCPDGTPNSAAAAAIEANVPLHIVDVEMQPPTGSERVFAVWTAGPLPVQSAKLQAIASGGEPSASPPRQATRDMVKVKKQIAQSRSEEACVTVLEVEHLATGA